MKELKIVKWKVKTPEGKEIDESFLSIVNALINNKNPAELPKGLEQFRLFGRIAKAFDEAEKTGVLKLEDTDYTFLKTLIEKDIPSFWGTNVDISKAVEDFFKC